ncbi:MAG: hypothetical protein ACI4RA_06260 [Kiritimatiellia bacterium]
MKWMTAVLAVLALVFGAGAFEKVPAAAMTALKGTRGKNISSGFVFVDGHYLKPPYRVARYGTAIYVNDVQITDQIVSWKSFLATQDGYVAPVKATAPTPAKKGGDDDLFDDAAPEPAAVKEDPAEAAAAAGFTPNAKSERLRKRIDEYRLDVQRKLRAGNVCFFGEKYARVIVEPRLARQLMAFLPEAMGDAPNAAALESACRSRGYPFISRKLCEDLLAHRADYLLLVERRRKLEEEESIQKMFDRAQENQR